MSMSAQMCNLMMALSGIPFVICSVGWRPLQRTIQCVFRTSLGIWICVIRSFTCSVLSGAHNSELVGIVDGRMRRRIRYPKNQCCISHMASIARVRHVPKKIARLSNMSLAMCLQTDQNRAVPMACPKWVQWIHNWGLQQTPKEPQ